MGKEPMLFCQVRLLFRNTNKNAVLHGCCAATPAAAACYDYNPQLANGTLKFICPSTNREAALGVSYQNRFDTNVTFAPAAEPYDQGIAFMDLTEPRPAPYFQ